MRLSIAVAVACLSIVAISAADPAQAAVRKQTNIPAQGLGPALQSLAADRELQVLYRTETVGNRRTGGAVGEFTVDEALAKLLDGTGLTFQYLDDKTVTIVPVVGGPAEREGEVPAGETGARASGSVKETRLTQNGPSSQSERSSSTEGRPFQSLDESSESRLIDEIVVTGSRIGGTADRFSPVQRYDRAYLDRAGYGSISELMASLPQNFGGGVSPDNVAAGSSAGPGAATVNLRGLDAGGTLTLLNGRRMAPSGTNGSFADISAIPTAAIERVEVLTDGASAIYGSDAVAGVVNFILRKNYDGAETRLRVGSITQGDGDDIEFAQTMGRSSESARALLSYQYGRSDKLLAADKPFIGGTRPESQILPDSERHSLFASGARALTDRIELSADAYYFDRNTEQTFSFANLQPARDEADVLQWGFSPAVQIAISDRWSASLAGAISRNEFLNVERNPAGAGFDDESETAIYTVDATMEGRLFGAPGGAVESVFGYSLRRDSFESTHAATGSMQPDIADRDRRVNAIFGEIFVPLVGEANRRPFVENLALSVAGRYEDYSDVGTSTNPKFGLLWSPAVDLHLRATYGTSFRAPRLDELVDRVFTAVLQEYVDPDFPGATPVALQVSGTSADLNPEKSEALTLGFDYEPRYIEHLKLRATYYDIEYTERIDTPTLRSSPPPFFRFQDFSLPPIRNPSLQTLQDYVARASLFLNVTRLFPTIPDADLSDATVLLLMFPQNTVATKTSGIDLGVTQTLDTAYGDWQFEINANYITRFDQQFSPVTGIESLYDIAFNPVDLRGRFGASWNRHGLTVAAFLNYTDDYTNDQTVGVRSKVTAWTTVDASVQYAFPARSNGILGGVMVTFSGQNLLDEDPPLLSGGLVLGPNGFSRRYDPTNADPEGRRVALQVVKRW